MHDFIVGCFLVDEGVKDHNTSKAQKTDGAKPSNFRRSISVGVIMGEDNSFYHRTIYEESHYCI